MVEQQRTWKVSGEMHHRLYRNYRNYRNYTARLVWKTNYTRPKQRKTACFYLTTANSKARTSHCIGAHFTSCVRYGVNMHMDSVATCVWHQLRPSVLKKFIPLCKEIRRNATLGSWYRLVLVSWWLNSKELGKYQARCITVFTEITEITEIIRPD